jgi:hypothetical protein
MGGFAWHVKEARMGDVAETDEGCGCCKPETKSAEDKVNDLLARRALIEERLTRLEPVSAGTR